jgi:hypothetical protein
MVMSGEFAPRDTTEVAVQARGEIGCDERFAVLGAEHEVDVQADK